MKNTMKNHFMADSLVSWSNGNDERFHSLLLVTNLASKNFNFSY